MHRHDLVWIDAQADWTALSVQAEPRLRAWMQAQLPLVVARRDPAVDGNQLRLGVPLPLAEQRQRLALRAAPGAVYRHARPLLLVDVIEALGVSCRPALLALHAACSAQALNPRVYGSHAWQALTGLDYLHAGSDLDLLWTVDSIEGAERICALLHDWETAHGVRADGELLFAGAGAVNWREYAGDAPQLLLKADDRCWLAPRAALLSLECAA